MKTLKKVVISVVAIAAIVGSASMYYAMRSGTAEPQIITTPVTRGDIVDSVGATGTLQAVTTVQVGSQVSGTISELHADFNSIVYKGDVIARLDPSLFQTQIEQASANLARSQADLDRLKVTLEDATKKLKRAQELSAKKLIPATDLENAEVAVRSAEAEIKSSEAQVTQSRASLLQNQVNLEHTVIAAPIDGIVISRNVDIGQTVAASMQAPTLFVIAADLTKMQVVASVDEADVGRIRPKQTVRFRVDAYPTVEFLGSVSQVRLQPVVVQNVVTYNTVIDVPNVELRLKPGMTANVTIEIARRSDVVRVPNGALRFRPTTDMFAALNQPVPPDLQRALGFRAPADDQGATGAQDGPSAQTPPAPVSGGRSSASAASSAAPPSGERGAGRQRGDGASGARGGDRQGFAERLQNRSPEEREQFMQRARARGFSPGAMGGDRAMHQEHRQDDDVGDRSAGADAAGADTRPQQNAANTAASRAGGATTIDSLFGPLPTVESVGRAWLYSNNQLKAVRLHLGVSDGTSTELISDEIQPGTELVTGIVLSGPVRQTSPTASPLLPQRPQFNRPWH